jgi:hypothetical protein
MGQTLPRNQKPLMVSGVPGLSAGTDTRLLTARVTRTDVNVPHSTAREPSRATSPACRGMIESAYFGFPGSPRSHRIARTP